MGLHILAPELPTMGQDIADAPEPLIGERKKRSGGPASADPYE
jgi:hypothetical protein